MEPGCDFPRDYLPTEGGSDPTLDLHLRNCADCQSEMRPIAGGHSWAFSFDAEA